MLKKVAFTAFIAIVFAVLGSQVARLQAKHPHAGQKCQASGNCKVKIFVEQYCLPSSCEVYVDFELTEVKGQQSHKITWDIKESSYTFAQNGISPIPDSVSNSNSLSGCKSTGNQQFTCDNDPNNHGAFKYSVNLTGAQTLDPWVVND